MTAQVRQEGHHINRTAVQRHMREMGIVAIYPGPNLSRRAHQAAVAPYLLRHLTPAYPNHVWAIDITSIRLTRSWLYLVAVIGFGLTLLTLTGVTWLEKLILPADRQEDPE